MSAGAWRAALEQCVGSKIASVRALGGGDINEAYAVALADRRALFVKTRQGAAPAMYAREASGLRWLAEAHALRVPEVIAEHEMFLALEMIEGGRKARDHDEALGRGLARLHRHGAPSFGLAQDNFIGSLPQPNTPASDWPCFYGERRLLFQLRMAIDRGRASARLESGIERVVARLPSLVGPSEPPSRLHGDLWAGNAHTDEQGRPVLIDPAVYGGHREIDLAMMKLFGGFLDRVFEAYDEEHPLESGWQDRIPLYQLYPLMVHVNLFGGGYASSVERIVARF